jgi:hypothetical protein
VLAVKGSLRAENIESAWHKLVNSIEARGKHKNQIVVALGRELLGFIWAIGVRTEQAHKLASAA